MNAPTVRRHRMFALALVVGLAASAVGLTGGTLLSVPTVAAASTNISQGKPVTCSSIQTGYPCANAVDGSTTTRWSSAFSDPQWIYVDLGATHTISKVVLNWEAAYGKAFQRSSTVLSSAALHAMVDWTKHFFF